MAIMMALHIGSTLLMVCLSFGAGGAALYVDISMAESGDGTSWQTAFKAIQEGIDAASHGDTVIVAEGSYVENIEFSRKNIVLTGTDPLDSDVVQGTIIDGNQAGSVITFDGSEDETCVLSGFTITNGSGGISGAGTHATIQNNVVSNNDGRGLDGCDGTI